MNSYIQCGDMEDPKKLESGDPLVSLWGVRALPCQQQQPEGGVVCASMGRKLLKQAYCSCANIACITETKWSSSLAPIMPALNVWIGSNGRRANLLKTQEALWCFQRKTRRRFGALCSLRGLVWSDKVFWLPKGMKRPPLVSQSASLNQHSGPLSRLGLHSIR